jgi:hypothetical protein
MTLTSLENNLEPVADRQEDADHVAGPVLELLALGIPDMNGYQRQGKRDWRDM